MDYEPVYGYWAFPMERLNKILKSYKTNSHASGELEVTFMREFQRDVRLREMIVSLSRSDDYLASTTAGLLLETESDGCGTVAGLAREMENGTRDFLSELTEKLD